MLDEYIKTVEIMTQQHLIFTQRLCKFSRGIRASYQYLFFIDTHGDYRFKYRYSKVVSLPISIQLGCIQRVQSRIKG